MRYSSLAVCIVYHPVLHLVPTLLWSRDEEGVDPEVEHFVPLPQLILFMEELHFDVSTNRQWLREFKINLPLLVQGYMYLFSPSVGIAQRGVRGGGSGLG